VNRSAAAYIPQGRSRSSYVETASGCPTARIKVNSYMRKSQKRVAHLPQEPFIFSHFPLEFPHPSVPTKVCVFSATHTTHASSHAATAVKSRLFSRHDRFSNRIPRSHHFVQIRPRHTDMILQIPRSRESRDLKLQYFKRQYATIVGWAGGCVSEIPG
jgi:hypothetical protein